MHTRCGVVVGVVAAGAAIAVVAVAVVRLLLLTTGIRNNTGSV